MIEFGSLLPIAQGGLVVGVIIVLSLVLYIGYGMIERLIGNLLLQAILNT